jgi:hypothetical protein
MDLRQSSFSLFWPASFVRTASMSTADRGAAAGALLAPVAPPELDDAGPAPAPGEVGGGLAPAWPKIVEMMLPSTDMSLPSR